jgi:stearoyl-CoA desaturase (delta-9 desaturase)
MWSHVGWILSPMYKDVSYDEVPEFSKYPELRFIDKHDWIAPWTLGVIAFLWGGWPGLVVGFFGSTVLLWHGTFMVNSVTHLFGRRRYDTPDTSRNNWFVALITFGEGWHNNHHHYPMSVKQGFKWWEYDVSFYILKALSWVGVVKDMKYPPRRALESRLIKGGSVTELPVPEAGSDTEPEERVAIG